MEVFIIFINLISISLGFIAIIISARKYCVLSEINEGVMSKIEKDELVDLLVKTKYISFVSIVINIFNLFLPNLLFKFVVPAISIIILMNIIVESYEKIITYSAAKDKCTLYMKYKKNRDEEIKMKQLSQLKEKKELQNKRI